MRDTIEDDYILIVAVAKANESNISMKHSIRRPFWLLIAAGMVTAILSGCSPKIEPAAVGKWRTAGGNETMEFRADGSCQGQDQYGRAVSGKFAFVDAEHIRLELTTSSEDKAKGLRFVDNSTGVVKVAVNGDELVMTEPNGSAIHYQRQK